MLTLKLIIAFAATVPTPSRAYDIDDQVRLRRIGAFDVSPDGRTIVFQVRSTDYEANKGVTDLWSVNSDGSELRQLTTHPETDTDPKFASDGKSVFFLSTRSGSSQVWRIPIDGGEATQITKFPLDVNVFGISPDGNMLAVALDVFVDCDADCTKKRLDELAKNKASGKIYDSLFVRHWDTWNDGRRQHLFTVPVAGGPARDVMKKMNSDSPPKPFGGAEEFTFTPDSKYLVFTASDVGRSEAWSTDLDLFIAPIDGQTPPKKLTTQNRAIDSTPKFSKDGKTLAYLATSRPGYESDRRRVVLRAWPNGPERVLTSELDISVDSLEWSNDSKSIVATADYLGQHPLFSIDVITGKVNILVISGHVTNALSASKKVFYALDTLGAPADLFVRGADGDSTRLTHVNSDKLAGVQFGQSEQMTFVGSGGDKVYAWLVKPVGLEPKRKYPVALFVHGGPQGSFGNDFHYRWNPQVFAGRGYAVLMVDFHGSTGYGQAFTDAIRGDWGGKPLEDLQKGLSAAITKYPFLDQDRVCALGASYGAYLVNWIAGRWSDRFRCLVSHDGNLDERAAYFDTEELWFPEWEHGGTPWENPAGYSKHNPVDEVAKWKTPMLVVHGGRDYRVVDTQGLSTFTALQRRGIPSKLLYFPDENHWVLKPQNSVRWHNTVLDWLDKWTRR